MLCRVHWTQSSVRGLVYPVSPERRFGTADADIRGNVRVMLLERNFATCITPEMPAKWTISTALRPIQTALELHVQGLRIPSRQRWRLAEHGEDFQAGAHPLHVIYDSAYHAKRCMLPL